MLTPFQSGENTLRSDYHPWLIIIIFTLTAFVHGIQAFGYVAVPEITKGYYQTDMKGVTWTVSGLSDLLLNLFDQKLTKKHFDPMKSHNYQCREWNWYPTSCSLYGYDEAENDSIERNWPHGQDFLRNDDLDKNRPDTDLKTNYFFQYDDEFYML